MAFLQEQFGEMGFFVLAVLALFEIPAVLGASRTLREVWARIQDGESPRVMQLLWLAILGFALGGVLLIGAQTSLLFLGVLVVLGAATLIVDLAVRTVGGILSRWTLLPAVTGGALVVGGLAIVGRQVGSGQFGEDLQGGAALIVVGGIMLVASLRDLMGRRLEPMLDDPLERFGYGVDRDEKDGDPPALPHDK